ncbi:uncharacterized protein LOC123710590 [Pieris brassicae]|uniref:uncharacterized protein LOC123710590 n=1 Tax=Pieris brassicae TaxID=7116 RepID=UPI001E6626F5|nr:uncharacterized protein LOC123710590 [Pieris brassicae]
MSKCDQCNKPFSKSLPGCECARCEKMVHLNTRCSGLTNKQITALKAAPSLDWTCMECQQESPKRNSSLYLTEDAEEDIPMDTKGLIQKISKEVEKTIKKEINEFNQSLQFHSTKLDEVLGCIDAFKNTIKVLERKNTELIHKNNNLELRVGALEQRFHEMEQEKLSNFIEIANVPPASEENVRKLVENVALKLKQPFDSIRNTMRYQGKNDQPGIIQVKLNDKATQEKWIKAPKTIKTMVADVCPYEPNNNKIVFIREAMTKHNKSVLWEAKQELKNKQGYKYVWFKNDMVRARKDENTKIQNLRSVLDIQVLKKDRMPIN